MNTYIDTSWIEFNESDYIVGNTLNDVYLELDSDGYRVLKDLYQSKRNYTISEIQEIYSDIEIEGFVKQMIDCNLLSYIDTPEKKTIVIDKAPPKNEKIIKIIYLLSLIFFIFNIFYLFKYWNRIFIIDFQKNNPLFLFVIMFVFGFIFNFLHELGHFYAAKLTKIDSKIKISQRFIFFLTFECDMSSIWLVENKRRIFPIVAGILTDNILLTVLIGLTTVIESPILFLILFIQYTKNLYHLLIPFKTDLYFLLLFSLNKKSNKELILKTSHYLGYFFLSLIMFIYFIQLYNLYSYATSSSSVEWATLLAIVIILLPIIIFIKERRQKIA